MLRLLAGVAALAMAAAPAQAQPGKNGDKGNGKPAASASANGSSKGNRGGPSGTRGKPDRDSQVGNTASQRGKAKSNEQSNAGGNRDRAAGPLLSPGKANDKAARKGFGPARRDAKRGTGPKDGYAGSLLRDALGLNRGLVAGCPPGLAKKRNGCLPPGQASKQYRSYRPSLLGLTGLTDGRYYLNDGYLLRYGDSGLAGFIPLLAGALSIGSEWPGGSQTVALPDYYADYYRLGAPRNYRYADNVVYRVDPETAAISSIAAILTGDDFVVGQPMPRGYDIYNVPYAYRDRYYDTPDARYRYADGYVYRIDPETALITAAIDLVI